MNGCYIDPNPPRHLVELLRARFPEAGLLSEEFRGEITVTLPAERLVDAALFLRDDPQCAFDLPIACVAVHFLEGEFEHDVMWLIYSLEKNHRLRLKLRLRPGETAPSLTSVWAGTNWTEREQYDLVGVRFTGHPDLRRIIMPEDYPDHPLRKDFDVEGGPSSLDPDGRPASPGFRDMEHA